MRLLNFSVSNFRSITRAHRIAISSATVLIGKNNEGKSNILHALNVAMSILEQHARSEVRRVSLLRRTRPYVWSRDFPVQSQGTRGSATTILKLEFELSPDEIVEFRQQVGSNLNGVLPLEIKVGRDDQPQIKVVKQGPGSASLAAKSNRIAEFVASKIHFNYIPAVRTDEAATELVSELLSAELRTLENDGRYQAALDQIADLQKPVLDRLARTLEEPLKEFLPTIQAVRVEISDTGRRFALRRGVDIFINDGNDTSLEYKGDGVKSLAALGLLKFRNTGDGATILAIEEPEAHLHPGAIHQVSDIVRSVSENAQVIVTTHNPLFVDRLNLKSNILVQDGSAVPAKNIGTIREALGIKASDNLINANFALVVEGEEDVIAMRAILPVLSNKIGAALRAGMIVFEPIGGAGNLSYKLSLLRTMLCTTHSLLDGDDEGFRAYERAVRDGLCTEAGCTFVRCQGFQEAEFEDCVDPEVYKRDITDHFGVSLDCRQFRGGQKWSKRIRACFEDQGKLFNDTVCSRVKYVVAKAVERAPANALHQHKRNSVDALVAALERMLQ